MKSYWSEPAHATWQSPYFRAAHGGYMLGFTRAWRDANLPPDSTSGGLLCTFLDATDGKEYTMPIYVAYEHEQWRGSIMDSDWNQVDAESLMSYWYGCHHCPCHRKQDAEAAGAVVEHSKENGSIHDCEGNRFQIKKVVARDMLDLILYSETMTEDELEEALLAIQQVPA